MVVVGQPITDLISGSSLSLDVLRDVGPELDNKSGIKIEIFEVIV